MRPRIKLRSNISTSTVPLQSTLADVTTARQRELVTTLLQRYGCRKTADLLPVQIAPFTTELKAVLSGAAPDPSDSILDPTTMEIQ